MTRKTQKKLRKLLTLVCCAVMLVCVSVGATIAYLTSQDTVTNTFTVGNVQIKLDEAPVDANGKKITGERVKANEYHLLPGHEYDKDPTVTVLANSEECYVRMQVTVNKSDKLDAIFAPTGANLLSIFQGYDSTNWILKGNTENGNTRTYEFWYKETVKNSTTDTELDALFDSIKVPDGITAEQLQTLYTAEVKNDAGEVTTAEEKFEIKIVAHAIQADGFDSAEEAWAKF